MTNTYNNVYIFDIATITGPYEAKGPLGNYFDKSYKDLYFGEKSWELAEIKMLASSINMLLDKTKMKTNKIDALISGDLLNQNISSNFTAVFIFINEYRLYFGNPFNDNNKLNNSGLSLCKLSKVSLEDLL